MLTAFNDNLVFFVSPSDLAKTRSDGPYRPSGQNWSSVKASSGASAAAKPATTFRITDGANGVDVS